MNPLLDEQASPSFGEHREFSERMACKLQFQFEI